LGAAVGCGGWVRRLGAAVGCCNWLQMVENRDATTFLMKRVTTLPSAPAAGIRGSSTSSGWNYNDALANVVKRIVVDYKGDNVKFFSDMRARHGLRDPEAGAKKAVAKR